MNKIGFDVLANKNTGVIKMNNIIKNDVEKINLKGGVSMEKFIEEKEKAVVYCKVSTKGTEETERYSLAFQEDEARKYAQRNNLEIVKVYNEAENAFGKGRKTFSNMLEYIIKHSDIKHIIFFCQNRKISNSFDMQKIQELIEEERKTVHFITGSKIREKLFPYIENLKMNINKIIYEQLKIVLAEQEELN